MAVLKTRGISLVEYLTLPIGIDTHLRPEKSQKAMKDAKWTTGLSFDEILGKGRQIASGKVGEVFVSPSCSLHNSIISTKQDQTENRNRFKRINSVKN